MSLLRGSSSEITPFLHASWLLETSCSVELPLNMYKRWFGDGQLVDLCTSVTPSGFGDGRYWRSGPFQVTSGVKISTTRCSNVFRINRPSVSPCSVDRFPTPKRPMSLKKSWGLLPWPHGSRVGPQQNVSSARHRVDPERMNLVRLTAHVRVGAWMSGQFLWRHGMVSPGCNASSFFSRRRQQHNHELKPL